MGFEQLAALKAQLTKEAKAKKQQEERAAGKPAPAAKQGGKPAAKHGAKPAANPAAKAERSSRPGGQARSGDKTPPVDPVVRVIGKLQKRFPAAFPKNPAPKVPLKVGILADLMAQAADLQLSEAEIREAVSTWCRGSRYWACLTDGAARVDLSGEPAGAVTARDAAFARNQAKGGPGSRRKAHQGKGKAAQASAGQAGADQVVAEQVGEGQAGERQASADQANADHASADQATQANASQANANANANAEAAEHDDEKGAQPARADADEQSQTGADGSEASSQ